MTVAELNRFPEDAVLHGRDGNRLVDLLLGNDGGQRKWLGYDGTVKDVHTGATSSTGNYADIIQTSHGKHLSVRHSAGSADTPAGQVFAVDDDFALIGRGKEARWYNAAGTNSVAIKHSGTNDILEILDSVKLSMAAARIIGDFDNATLASRTLFQGSSTNARTSLGAIPNGTSTDSAFLFFNNAAPASGQYLSVGASATAGFLDTSTGAFGIELRVAGTARLTVAAAALTFADTLTPGTTATYDLGTTAATWRDLFLSRKAFIGGTTNANLTTGLTISQGAADDQILAFKSSDVAHGMTDFAETDTYGALLKHDANAGGLKIRGFSEATASMVFQGFATTDDTTAATTTVGVVTVDAWKKSGTGITTPGANAALFVVRHSDLARFLVDAEGDVKADATVTGSVWDEHEDVALLEAFRLTTMREEPPDFRRLFADDLAAHAETLARTGVLALNEDGRHFFSLKGVLGLTMDSIRQTYGRLRETQARVGALERRLLALEGT